MTEAEWVTAAMADNDVVAEVLVKLRVNTSPSSKRRRPAPPQSWTIRQRRSRTQPPPTPQLPASSKPEPPRASPSTPLSWSGATSVSGGGGAPIADVLDSAQPNHNCSDISRSKVRPLGETTPTTRPRKKKSLAALKEEGNQLLEEQNDLKMKLAALQLTCEKQRKENERLKKIQVDLQVETLRERPKVTINNHFEAMNEQNDKIILPDLNVPFGEDVIVSC